MNCKYHNDIKGTNTCHICGCWICENCLLEIDGRIYCKDCLRSKLKDNTTNKSFDSFKNNTNNKSKLLAILLALIFPGTAQIYLGYTKRGLIILSFFMLGMYVDAFSVLVVLSYIFGLFDTFRLKNNLEKGIYQEDNFSDVKKFISENKFFVAVLSIIIIVPMIFDFFEDLLDDFFDICKNIFNCFGIYLYDLEDIFKMMFSLFLAFIVVKLLYKKYKNNNKNNN